MNTMGGDGWSFRLPLGTGYLGITAQIKASAIYSATGEGQGERHISYLVSIGMVIAEDWGELDI